MALIEAVNLTKIYGCGDTAVTALDHVHIKIEAGQFTAVMGPSGCGKSTLLNLLGALDRPSDGQVLIAGKSMEELSDDALAEMRRRKIGFVFQFYNLIPVLTALENTALPLTLDGVPEEQARQKATEWLQQVGLGSRMSSQPGQLSGGQQQRVAVARALVAGPELILADEPTGNLDSRSADEIAMLLRQVANEWGRAVLMVTHDAHVASYADRILFLKDGAVLFDENRPESEAPGSTQWVSSLVQQVS
jgi:putative ABC transport system ATP-binding protein